jgi:hypothetical protein
VQVFLYSRQPWPASMAMGGRTMTVPTTLTMLRGAVSVQSQLLALESADLQGVSYPGYPTLQLSQDQVGLVEDGMTTRARGGVRLMQHRSSCCRRNS